MCRWSEFSIRLYMLFIYVIFPYFYMCKYVYNVKYALVHIWRNHVLKICLWIYSCNYIADDIPLKLFHKKVCLICVSFALCHSLHIYGMFLFRFTRNRHAKLDINVGIFKWNEQLNEIGVLYLIVHLNGLVFDLNIF